MSELLNCPFCYSANVTIAGTQAHTYICCEDCKAGIPGSPYGGRYYDLPRDEAIERWNRRTPQPVTPAGGEVEAVAKVCLVGEWYGSGNFSEVHMQLFGGFTPLVGQSLYTSQKEVTLPDELKPDDGNGDDDAYNRGWNECRARVAALNQRGGG